MELTTTFPRSTEPPRNIRPDQPHMLEGLQRLRLLMPEAVHLAPYDLQGHALAFVERYQDNVLQLWHEWQIVYAAAMQAWERGAYSAVVRLVSALAHSVGRIGDPVTAEHILSLGIEASRYTQDRQHHAYFLNRLGGLLFSYGNYQQGSQTWLAALQLAGSTDAFVGIWEPLASFVLIVDILGAYAPAWQFVDTLLQTQRISDPDMVAVAIFIRGFLARFREDLDRAYADISSCLQLLSQAPDTTQPIYRQLFKAVVQAELERTQGNYARSQEYAETAIALAQLFSDLYTAADLLIDQGLFASRLGRLADAHASFARLGEIAQQMKAPHLYKRSLYLQRLLNTSPQKNLSKPQKPLSISSAPEKVYDLLSERELEVLRLTAMGLSNREIAARLVVTIGTVKKHLEHIYTRLDVHSRTAAIARARTLKLIS